MVTDDTILGGDWRQFVVRDFFVVMHKQQQQCFTG